MKLLPLLCVLVMSLHAFASDFSVSLRLTHEKELNTLLEDLYNPSHPSYRKFLSVEEFTERFSPKEEEVLKVITSLHKHGMKVTGVDKNRLLLHVDGNPYRIADVVGESTETFTSMVLGIHGLGGEEEKIHPGHLKMSPLTILPPLQGSGPHGGFAPSDLRKAYGIPGSLEGVGQTIAIYALDGFTTSDIDSFRSFFKLPKAPPVETVLVGSATGIPGIFAQEVTLDIELAMGMAPMAQIIVYEGVNGGGIIPTYNRIASENRAKVVSTSWGAGEGYSISDSKAAENQIFKQMAAQGQSMFAASGDHGPYDGTGTKIMPNDPASQPFVTGVGGTQLVVNPDFSYKSETTWNVNGKPLYGASGGGISTLWAIPDYQGASVSSASKGSITMRNVPDVSANAALNTGDSIYFQGRWNVVGGTSCSAPLWAAFTSLANEWRQGKGMSVLGFMNPPLYRLGQSNSYPYDFHDINDGSNNILYPAVLGYDLATGLGSFRGNLINDLSLK